MVHPFMRREWWISAGCALIAALVMVYALNPRPTYLDSYYHVNAAARLASGAGLTDPYLWIYLGMPPDLPVPITITPSHIYWMPATTLLSGAFMAVFGENYAVAQIPIALSLAGAILIAALAGGWAGGEKRHAIGAMLLMIFSGSYLKFWGEVDTFAPYALFGAGALAAVIYARETKNLRWWFAAGLLCGAGHLTRSDGLLLIIVAVLVALLSARKSGLIFAVAGYLVVMTPWFIRMYGEVGAILPVGGLQTAYLTTYDQIFTYPWQELSLGSVGVDALIQARIASFPANLVTFIINEGWLILWPFMLFGLLRARGGIRLTVGLFALGVHAAMMLVFAWPGVYGGLQHAASALMPFWSALVILGAESLARRISRPRNLAFTRGVVLALVIGFAVLSTFSSINPRKSADEPVSMTAIRPLLAPDSRVMGFDPGQNYYFLGVGGVILPEAPLETLPQMAETFALDYLVLEQIKVEADGTYDMPGPDIYEALLTDDTPPFLELIEDFGHTRLYRFVQSAGVR